MLSGYASKPAVRATAITMSALATVFTTLRLYARFGVSRNAGWDDALIFMALLFSLATMTSILVQIETGLSEHIYNLSKPEVMDYFRALWVIIIVYNLALICTKLSILLQYIRIFPQKPFRIAVWLLMGIVSGYALWRVFSAIFTCVPVNAFWDHSIKGAKCQDREALSMASTSLNMITDLAIAILPLPLIHKLQLPSRQKYALMAVFALAGSVVIVSILRVPSVYDLMRSKDSPYSNPMAAIWSVIETNVGIICSCLPTLRCLFPKLLKNATSYNASAAGHSFTSASKKSNSLGFLGTAGSFAGKFRTTVSSTHQAHRTLRGGFGGAISKPTRRKDPLLESNDDIEMGPGMQPAACYDPYEKGIHVRTEIEQVEVNKDLDDPMPSTRPITRHPRNMI